MTPPTDPARVALIRYRLSKASPAPWHIGHVSERGGIHEDAEIDDTDGCVVAEVHWRRDQALIASAPDDLLFLLAQLDQAEAELRRQEHSTQFVITDLERGYEKRIDALKEERDGVAQALEREHADLMSCAQMLAAAREALEQIGRLRVTEGTSTAHLLGLVVGQAMIARTRLDAQAEKPLAPGDRVKVYGHFQDNAGKWAGTSWVGEIATVVEVVPPHRGADSLVVKLSETFSKREVQVSVKQCRRLLKRERRRVWFRRDRLDGGISWDALSTLPPLAGQEHNWIEFVEVRKERK